MSLALDVGAEIASTCSQLDRNQESNTEIGGGKVLDAFNSFAPVLTNILTGESDAEGISQASVDKLNIVDDIILQNTSP